MLEKHTAEIKKIKNKKYIYIMSAIQLFEPPRSSKKNTKRMSAKVKQTKSKRSIQFTCKLEL